MLAIPLWLLRGRASFKARIAARANLDVSRLPYNTEFLEYLRDERERGRRIVLATGANRAIAQAVADHLDIFHAVIASDDSHNCKGEAKRAAIESKVGPRYVYAGDSHSDLPIWRRAEAAILVRTTARLATSVRSFANVEREFQDKRSRRYLWLKAIRAHQWLKNLLVFVPTLTAFAFHEPQALLAAVTAFFAMSLAASATYILNDLHDLESDRAHPRKYDRPLASGSISIFAALAAAGSLLAGALALCTLLPWGFFIVLLLYLALTTLYSFRLKKIVGLDVLVLSVLYTLRVIAGSVAIGVVVSSWILAFSIFIFFSLALVKRCSELVLLESRGEDEPPGRGYQVRDLAVCTPMGVAAGLSAVVVFGLFVSTVETQSRYASPQLLWPVGLGLIYWIARIWIKTLRGEMHDDPLVFAARDAGSRATIIAMAISDPGSALPRC